MKPFNLQDALSGKPVQTRDGRKVTQITKFNINPNATYSIAAVIDDCLETFRENGWFKCDSESGFDLFMSEQEQKPRCVVIKGLHVYDCDNEQHANEVAKEMNGIVFKQVL